MDKKVGHVRRYTLKELQYKLIKAGFIVDESYYVDSIGFIATLVYKLIGDKNGDINSKSLKIYDRYIFPVSVLADKMLKYFFGKNIYVLARKV